MQTEKYKNKINISFGLGLLFIVLLLISFWNAFINHKDSVGIFPFVFFLLSIAAFIYMYMLVTKATNTETLKEYIEEQINIEKNLILSNIKKETEDNTAEEETEVVDEQEIKKSIIPGGSFKKADTFSKKLLSNLAGYFNLGQAILYQNVAKTKKFSFVAGYGLTNEEPIPDFIDGEGLNGEAAKSKEIMVIEDVPEDYFELVTGLGNSKPKCLVLLPVLSDNKTIALIEMASFSPINEKNIKILEKFSDIVSNNLNQLFKV
jgi:hypothetical protein